MASSLWKFAFSVSLGLSLLVACSEDDPGPEQQQQGDTTGISNGTASNGSTSNGTTEAALTWHRDVKPILDANCVACHQAGGGAPFDLDSYEAFKPLAVAAMAAIDAGTMPPWLPDPDCREFADQRVMPAEQIDTLRAWIDLDMSEGDPRDAPERAEEVRQLFEPTHTIPIAESYTPNVDLPDDYRCFILDHEFEEDMYMTGSAVVPDAKALVHHVLVYAMDPASVDLITTADQNEAGPGYTCFGAPWPDGVGELSLSSLPNLVGGWVPGQTPNLSGPDASVRIVAGSKLVMQVHYNTLAAPPTSDTTAIQMALQTEPTALLAYTRPLVIIDLEIPAGEPSAAHSREFRNYGDETISIGRLAPHMHLLGKSFRSEITRANGSKECLLDIQDWDFNWQQSYHQPDFAIIELAPGESISMECVFDNSAANQPVINGEAIEPRDVRWGEGTLDEMCLMYLSFVEPYAPPTPAPDPRAGACAGVKECQESCPEGASSAECLLGCEGLSEDCLYCSVEGLFGCTPCAPNFVPLLDCFTDCAITTSILKGKLSNCLKTECGDGYDRLAACIDPAIESGACDEALRGCGIER